MLSPLKCHNEDTRQETPPNRSIPIADTNLTSHVSLVYPLCAENQAYLWNDSIWVYLNQGKILSNLDSPPNGLLGMPSEGLGSMQGFFTHCHWGEIEQLL